MSKSEKVEKILEILSKQSFWDFYAENEGPFEEYLNGLNEKPTKNDILQAIERLFKPIL